MRVGIVGGGFGIYGWLPALVSSHEVQIVTLERYRVQLQLRPELRVFEKRMTFVEDLRRLISRCEYVVIARRPADQFRFVEELASLGWKGCVVLEKPLAPNPEMAEALLEILDHADIRVVVGFSLCETGWAATFGRYLAVAEPIHIRVDWRFLAHHYRYSLANWKRQPTEGGGALRFFAIHLVAWLARADSWKEFECSPLAEVHEDPAVRFTVKRGSVEVSILCDTCWNKEPLFTIQASRHGCVVESCALRDPFDESMAGGSSEELAGQDKRVVFLRRIIIGLLRDGGSRPTDFLAHVKLWGQIERVRPAGNAG
jgi:predicted dehydrogenase